MIANMAPQGLHAGLAGLNALIATWQTKNSRLT